MITIAFHDFTRSWNSWNRQARAALLVTLGAASARAQDPCDTDSIILNTGYDHVGGSTLATGTSDARWSLVLDDFAHTSEPRPASVIDKNGAWAAPDAGSQWISGYPTSVQTQNGPYVFKAVFCLGPTVDLNTSTLQFGMRGDDGCFAYLNEALVDVLPNGSAIPFHTGNGFNAATLTIGTYTLASIGAVPGTNTLYVRVQNSGGGAMGLDVVASVSASPSGSALQPGCCEPNGSLQGQKYADANGNGLREFGEGGIPGWRIDLLGGSGLALSAVTDGLGYYAFTDLPADSYTLTEEQRTGWTAIAPASGVRNVSLAALQSLGGLDFANQPAPCLGDGVGGPIPALDTGDGVWPNTLPSSPMSGTNLVYVPNGLVLNSVTLRGLSHSWAGDVHVVLETPSGLYNLLHRPGATATNYGCSDDFAGDYVIVDRVQGGPCLPISDMQCLGGTIAPGTYLQQFGSWPGGMNAQNVDLEDIPLWGTLGVQLWTLHIYDWAGGDVGSLASWEVCFGVPSTPPPPHPNSPVYECTGALGDGGSYPLLGAAAGIWPNTLPTGVYSSALFVTVPPGSTKLTAVKLHGFQHSWYGDNQIVLQAPSGIGGTLYNVMQVFDGGNSCAEVLNGNFTFVDETLGLDDCGNPAGYPPACSGSIPPGTYLQTTGTWPNGASSIFNTPLQSIPIASGVWMLHFIDWFPSADDGSIVSWELCFDKGVPQIYCTSGTTTNGCVGSISATSNPSLTLATPCRIDVTGIEGAKTGLIFYGTGAAALPWSAGSSSFLCVKAPTQRTPVQSSGGTNGMCDGSFSLNWDAYQAANPAALGQPWAVGSQVFVQAWFRDPPAPKTTNLSNALEMTYVP
jgi:subtilisin-like proprotein convertase family protein